MKKRSGMSNYNCFKNRIIMSVLILERLRERKREKGCFSRYYLSAKLQMMNYDLSAFVSPTQRYHH